MTRLLKTFLIWLLMAALPLQGLAAVVSASCGPNHHSPSMVMADADAHHHDGGSAHHHGDSEAAAALAGGAPGDTENTQQASSCSACAACCVGATAPPSSLGLASADRISESVVSSPAVAFIGHIPASLDRPPQHSLV